MVRILGGRLERDRCSIPVICRCKESLGGFARPRLGQESADRLRLGGGEQDTQASDLSAPTQGCKKIGVFGKNLVALFITDKDVQMLALRG